MKLDDNMCLTHNGIYGCCFSMVVFCINSQYALIRWLGGSLAQVSIRYVLMAVSTMLFAKGLAVWI